MGIWKFESSRPDVPVRFGLRRRVYVDGDSHGPVRGVGPDRTQPFKEKSRGPNL